MNRKPKFQEGSKVRYPARDLKGRVVSVFWSDAGDPKQEGYAPRDEQYRYIIETKLGNWSVRESSLVRIAEKDE